MRPAAKNTVCRFQSTLSVRRATAADLLALLRAIISIHALRKESDVAGSMGRKGEQIFQSTLSVRRATM